MAKNNKNPKKAEPVTKCDQSKEVVANCDNLRSLKFYPSLPYAYTEQGIGQAILGLLRDAFFGCKIRLQIKYG